jgi:salicylate hydroxylase
MQETYGDPYFLIHRGDLHKVLLNRALEVGVSIKTSSFVSEINEAEPSVVLRDGSKYTADLVIGADGRPSSPRIVASAAKSLQASNPACEEP